MNNICVSKIAINETQNGGDMIIFNGGNGTIKSNNDYMAFVVKNDIFCSPETVATIREKERGFYDFIKKTRVELKELCEEMINKKGD